DKQTVLKFANALYDTRQFVQASTMYQRYLALEPADVNARVDLGVTYFELSRLDSIKHHEYLTLAEKEMKEALNYNPSHQFATFNLGIVYLHVGKMEEASEWFKKCIAIDSTSETGRKAQMLIQQHTFNNP
ncbi:MAG: tetratricopeptide repeat protein, partial [Bacteroidetes bacterium]